MAANWTVGDLELEHLERLLRPATLVFLALPVFLFAATWLRPAVAAATALATLTMVAPWVRSRSRSTPVVSGAAGRVSALALLAGLSVAVGPVLCSGAGGLNPRNWDWLKHDAVLRDLITQPWPVLYSTDGATTGLVYYVAYLLPAAAVGVLAGWKAANLTVLITSVVGVILTVLWLVVLSRGAPILCGCVFALYSGMDVLGSLLVSGGRGLTAYHLETWAGLWQYSSTETLVNFVPNQALAGWLLVALLVTAGRRGRTDLPLAVLPALALLWSPFVALGLLPLAVAAVVTQRRPPAATVRAQLCPAGLAAALVTAVLVTYFAARLAPLPLPLRFRQAGPAAEAGAFWWVPARVPLGEFTSRYLLFVLCEFAVLGLLVLLAARSNREVARMRPLILAALGWLLVLPLFHFGVYNDLAMRASIPALFLLLVAVLRVLRERRPRVVALLLAGVLAIGALYPANLLRWHLKAAVTNLRTVHLQPLPSVRTIFQLQLHDPLARRIEFVSQYLGSVDTPFYRCLARRSAAVVVADDDPQRRR